MRRTKIEITLLIKWDPHTFRKQQYRDQHISSLYPTLCQINQCLKKGQIVETGAFIGNKYFKAIRREVKIRES